MTDMIAIEIDSVEFNVPALRPVAHASAKAFIAALKAAPAEVRERVLGDFVKLSAATAADAVQRVERAERERDAARGEVRNLAEVVGQERVRAEKAEERLSANVQASNAVLLESEKLRKNLDSARARIAELEAEIEAHRGPEIPFNHDPAARELRAFQALRQWVNQSRLRSVNWHHGHAVAIDWTGFEFSVVASELNVESLAANLGLLDDDCPESGRGTEGGDGA